MMKRKVRICHFEINLYDSSTDENVGIKISYNLYWDCDCILILHYIKEEVEKDLDFFGLTVHKMSSGKNVRLNVRTCNFYQFQECKQDLFSQTHMDRCVESNQKAYVHCCCLCYKMTFGLMEHPLLECPIIDELDRKEADVNFVPKILKSKF